MTATELTTKIQSTFIGSNWSGEKETAEILKDIVGIKCEWYDNGIDNGVDYASFRFENSPLVVHIYYGDVTEEICYVEVLNAHKYELKITLDEYERMGKEFKITSVTREDLENRGFDTTNITDEQMERLASKMCDDYLEQMFWFSMEIIAEDVLNFPKRQSKD